MHSPNTHKIMKSTIFFTSLLLLFCNFLFAQDKKNDKTILEVVKVDKVINSIKNGSKIWTDSIHYDGENANSIGTGGAAQYGFYMLIPTDSLTAHTGKYLNDVKLYIYGPASNISSAEIRLYTDTTVAPVYKKSFTAIEGWNSVNIEPYALPSTGYLVVGYFLSVTGGHPAGIDAGVAEPNGNGDIVYLGGWHNLSELGINANFNIRAMIGDLPTNPIADISPATWNAGYIKIGETKTATFKLTNAGVGTLTITGISGISAPFTTDFNPTNINLNSAETTTFNISFTPTDGSATIQTATIATNVGDVNINLSGKGADCSKPISTFPWNDDFEYGINPCYTILDTDGDGANWKISNIFKANSGTGVITSASYINIIGALTPNNWLITPAFDFSNISNDYSLKFYVIGQDSDFSEEHYGVFVSTTDKNPANFTLLFEETLPAGMTSYIEKNFSLDAFKGNSTVYIAFRHFNSTNLFAINIDDIIVDSKLHLSKQVFL